jgi:hypothetical protein
MPELGRNGEWLPRLEAEVKNAIVLVSGEYEEILPLKGLMLTLLRRPAMVRLGSGRSLRDSLRMRLGG